MKRRAFFLGNVMVDSLFRFLDKANAHRLRLLHQLGLFDSSKSPDYCKPYAILTLHRPSNVDEEGKLAKIIDAIDDIGIPVIFPVHPRTRIGNPSQYKNIRFIEPLGYLDFLCLLDHATLVLTDSGGVQEETSALGVRCVTLRENTERPVTTSLGTNTLLGTESDYIRPYLKEAAKQGWCKPKTTIPMWDGMAGQRIITVLVNELASAT